MSKLHVATEGPCHGHPCDDCATCRRGRCCRRDRPDYRLPEFGAWDGPIFGAWGVLAVDEDKVQCHCCGEWFGSLANHVWRTHNLWADEYRAIFGLKATTGLIGPALRAIKQKWAETNLKGRTEGADFVRLLTPEQRSQLFRGKRRRLEQKLDPVNQRIRKEVGRKVSETLAARFAAGELKMPQPRDPIALGRKAGAIRRERFRDPEYRARIARKISETRGGRVAVSCVTCGTAFEVVPSTVKRGGGKVCGNACFRELRRRYATSQAPSKRPEVRAKIGVASRSRSGEVNARVSEMTRRRLHPDYDRTVERLRALAPGAFAGLVETTAEAIRLYFGLLDGRPHAAREICERLGFGRWRLSRILAAGVAALLGPDVVERSGGA